jgi:predicted transcriptional regulator
MRLSCQVTGYLTGPELEELDKLAKAKRVTRSWMVRSAILEFLKKEYQVHPTAETQ